MHALLFAALLAASPVKSDEQVILFPVAAHWDATAKAWTGEIHGWIFEPEANSDWRGEVIDSLEDAARLDSIEWDRDLFRERVRPFLADNERGKRLEVRIGDVVVPCEPSAANGHFIGKCAIPRTSPDEAITQLEVSVVLQEDDSRRFTSQVFLIPPQGVSVISDIDDTIKISNVTDKVELLRNTFARPFEPVPGMPENYQALAKRGAAFHFVSASPWQLFRPLETFASQAKYPSGTFDMKTFRAWDDSWQNLTADSGLIKTPAIERLLKEFPERKFLLIGDSGEADPEVYGAIARKHAEQILGLAIRGVRAGESLDDERFQAAFADIPGEKLLLFQDPRALEIAADAWCQDQTDSP